MATYTSTVTGTPVDQGSFSYTPPTPPGTTDGSLGSTYTLADGTTSLAVTAAITRGRSVNFSVTTGGVQYDFNGACDANEVIRGSCVYPKAKKADDPWTAQAQGGR